MKRLRAWHLSELRRLDPRAHQKLRIWHQAEIRQLNHICRLYTEEVLREHECALQDVHFTAG